MQEPLQQSFPQPNTAVSSHSIDDELIIFDDRSKQLTRLNQTASKIWCLHAEHNPIESIAEYLSEHYDIATHQLIPDIISALEEWQTMGMLGNDSSPQTEQIDDVLAYMQKIDASGLKEQEFHQVKSFKLLDSEFNILVSNLAIKNILLPLYAHFPSMECTTAHEIKVLHSKDRYVILEEDKVAGYCNSIDEIAPLMNAHILVTSLSEVDCLSVFHAGVVCDEDGVILLSAGSGSGKSTLTAALMCAEKQYFTDELAILTHSKKIRPAPGCTGLKQGAWQVIEEFFPSIHELTTHQRQDDKVVKYLPPLAMPSATQLKNGEPVKAIVFPNYSPQHETNLIKLSAADALVKITDAGYHSNQSLSHKSVENLIEWIQEIPAYELSMNDLSEAVAIIEKSL